MERLLGKHECPAPVPCGPSPAKESCGALGEPRLGRGASSEAGAPRSRGAPSVGIRPAPGASWAARRAGAGGGGQSLATKGPEVEAKGPMGQGGRGSVQRVLSLFCRCLEDGETEEKIREGAGVRGVGGKKGARTTVPERHGRQKEAFRSPGMFQRVACGGRMSGVSVERGSAGAEERPLVPSSVTEDRTEAVGT